MATANLLILGAGQYGMLVKETAESLCRFHTIDFLDDNNPFAIGKLAQYEHFRADYSSVFVAMGNPQLHMEWLDRLEHSGFLPEILIHPTAYVSPSAQLMPGTIVEPMAVVQSGATVDRGCLLCAGSIVNHNAHVMSGCQIDCGAVVASNAVVPEGTKVPCATVFQSMKEGISYV